ncbi:MAG: S1C family serine protease [Trueperaceae bacterium]
MNPFQTFSSDLKALVASAAPAVVGIEHNGGQGTGMVLTQDGYILTNRHVVGEVKKVGVRLSGYGRVSGEVIGRDAATDLAVVRVEHTSLTTLPLRKTAIDVGEIAVAIGNPFRFEGSVSLGIVSALDRTLPLGQHKLIEGLIQTDAAVNPGNSGGPLLDAWGNVMGVTTAIIPFAQGIGFAVPASTANWVAALLIQRGVIERPYLGIAGRSETLPSLLAQDVGQTKGVRVLEVNQNTPAQNAGLQSEDLLLAVDGQSVSSIDDLQRHMVLAKSSSVNLEVWRKGKREHVSITPFRLVPQRFTQNTYPEQRRTLN